MNEEFGSCTNDEKDCAFMCICSGSSHSPKRNRNNHIKYMYYSTHTRAQAPKLEWIKIGSQAHWIPHVRDCVSIDKNQLDKLRIMIIALGQCTQFAHSDSHKCSCFVCFFSSFGTQNTLVGYLGSIWNVPFFSRSNEQNIFDLRTQLNEIDMVLLYAYRLCIIVYFLNYMTCRWYGLRLFLSLSLVNQFALVRCDHRISEHFILVIHDEPLDAQKRGASQKGLLSIEHTTFVFWLGFSGKFDKIFSICTINVYRILNHMYYLFTWQYLPSDYIGKYNKHSINCFKCRPTGFQFMLSLSVIEIFHLFDA